VSVLDLYRTRQAVEAADATSGSITDPANRGTGADAVSDALIRPSELVRAREAIQRVTQISDLADLLSKEYSASRVDRPGGCR
jgi:hypothetical protein